MRGASRFTAANRTVGWKNAAAIHLASLVDQIDVARQAMRGASRFTAAYRTVGWLDAALFSRALARHLCNIQNMKRYCG
jgi:hypothetical protein